MQIIESKLFTLFIAGIFCGTILGFISFSKFMGMGEDSCGYFFCYLFNSHDYQSRGLFGILSGTSMGSFLGIVISSIILQKYAINNNLKKIALVIIGAILLPLVYAILSSLPNFEFDGIFLVLLPVIIFAVILSAVFSAIFIGIALLFKKRTNQIL